jgi:transcriptional regulator with GAF, ATPase, and Fis domain
MTLTQTEPTPPGRLASGGVHRLLVVFSASESDIGYSKVLTHDALVIGRDLGEQPCLALRQSQVSRQHARVETSDSGFRIRDLQSRNGTFVNGRRVDVAELRDGDLVRIGSTLLLFQFLDLAACELLMQPKQAFGRLVGRGHQMARVHEAIESAVPSAAPALILGETGVGKELVAEAIHVHSGRQGPFVPLNCSALPSNLVESELFGHVRGAFTGADARRGLFGRADKGTLFLDEIGEIPLDVQSKLLRALAIGEIRPVGSDQPRTVDVRIVAATNVDLEEAVERGAFRADLYARLLSHVIAVPPLRDRREDILELTRAFMRKAGEFHFTPDSAEALLIHGWPYNVRELEQVLSPVQQNVAKRGTLELGDLPPRIRQALETRFEPATASDLVPISLVGIRRSAVPSAEELRAVIESYDGNIAQVAAFFGKDRRQIYRWAQALHVDVQAVRERLTARPRE